MESPVLSSAQMHAAEESAFARGVSVETLMDQAGAGVARAVRQFFPKPATCIVFAGKGHNGGDALVAAEQLQRIGFQLVPRACRKKLARAPANRYYNEFDSFA